ncbi:hypothetical protein DPMN_150554 [Dreissena polymorpha]|uniref:Uncharacterized protein n=1 Tax=Dreissena polymorpha TaxID=45954 RepID=A0A9D4FGP1_DREPO|nr:hypothetical protein DPMN_150554 [Dreissena polymorpha]
MQKKHSNAVTPQSPFVADPVSNLRFADDINRMGGPATSRHQFNCATARPGHLTPIQNAGSMPLNTSLEHKHTTNEYVRNMKPCC